MTTKKRGVYWVNVTRERDAWLADVPDVPGAHTFARSLSALQRSVREVIVLMTDRPDDALDDFDLDVRYEIGDSSAAVAAARRARVEAEQAERASAEAGMRWLGCPRRCRCEMSPHCSASPTSGSRKCARRPPGAGAPPAVEAKPPAADSRLDARRRVLPGAAVSGWVGHSCCLVDAAAGDRRRPAIAVSISTNPQYSAHPAAHLPVAQRLRR